MPTAIVQVVGPRVVPKHTKVTLWNRRYGSFVCPTASPLTEFDLSTGQWDEVAIPGGTPHLNYAGRGLTVVRQDVIVRPLQSEGRSASVANRLRDLARYASGDQLVTLSYSTFERSSFVCATQRWAITGMRVTMMRRQQGSNDPVNARVALELKEAAGPLAQATVTGDAWTVVARARAAQVGVRRPTRDASTPRRYTVRPGDTLQSIAFAVYGAAEAWPYLAEANLVRDPRRLDVGKVLVVP